MDDDDDGDNSRIGLISCSLLNTGLPHVKYEFGYYGTKYGNYYVTLMLNS